MVKEGNDLITHVELPGVDPKDVEITVTGNLLTIKGERKLEKEYNNEDYFSREISYGSFERSVTLPVEVNADKIKATYKKGLLEIRMPAAEAIQGTVIKENDMARIGTAYLDTNDMFPKMEFQMVSGEKLELPEGMGQGYSVVLIYRGEW
jgi:hypothetical protein